MKTDQELNRLIAERVLGWTDVHEEDGRSWGVPPELFKRESRWGASPFWDVPAHCTDPAAWGALFVWLKEQGKRVSIDANILKVDYFATVGTDGRADSLPGGALVLATLAAYGVEVE